MKNDRAGVKMEFVAILAFLLVPAAQYDVGVLGVLAVFLFAAVYIKKEWIIRQTVQALLVGVGLRVVSFTTGLVETGWNVYLRYVERKTDNGYGLDYDIYYRPLYDVTNAIVFIGMILALLFIIWGIVSILTRGEAGIPFLRRTAKWAVEKIRVRDAAAPDIEEMEEELAAEEADGTGYLFQPRAKKTETDDSFFAPPEE